MKVQTELNFLQVAERAHKIFESGEWSHKKLNVVMITTSHYVEPIRVEVKKYVERAENVAEGLHQFHLHNDYSGIDYVLLSCFRGVLTYGVEELKSVSDICNNLFYLVEVEEETK